MSINLNDPRIIPIHKEIIKRKKYLYHFYKEAYEELIKHAWKREPVVELGSGGGFLKKIVPKVITSDVVAGPDIDRVFSVHRMPFADKSVGAFVMFSVLHHIKSAETAFSEMERCLKQGGKIVMIEPFSSPLSSFIFKNFHRENFDPEANWKIKGKGRLTDANLALPWIIFVRDKKLFELKFPHLKIIRIQPHTPFNYMLSGGLSYSWSFPLLFYGMIKFIEVLLSPFNSYLAMFVTIEIEKIKT